MEGVRKRSRDKKGNERERLKLKEKEIKKGGEARYFYTFIRQGDTWTGIE